MPSTTSTDELNLRIDALVTKMDDLISVVSEQDRLRRRLNSMFMITVVLVSVVIAVLGVHQGTISKRVACHAQNDTRTVVRNLLSSANDAATTSVPSKSLTPLQLEQFKAQVAQAKVFYAAQIAKVQPLKC